MGQVFSSRPGPFAMPEDLVTPLLEALEPVADTVRASGMYGDQLPVQAEAPAAERLLAFVGRSSASAIRW